VEVYNVKLSRSLEGKMGLGDMLGNVEVERGSEPSSIRLGTGLRKNFQLGGALELE